MLPDHHERKGDPDENQRHIQDKKGLRRKGQKLDPDEDCKGRNPVAHADEKRVDGRFAFVFHLRGSGQPQDVACRVVDGVVGGVLYNFHGLDDGQDRNKGHGAV